MAAGTPLTLIPLPPLGGEGTLTESALLPIGTLAPHANVWRGGEGRVRGDGSGHISYTGQWAFKCSAMAIIPPVSSVIPSPRAGGPGQPESAFSAPLKLRAAA